jgi:hypothetical protein
MKTAQHTPGPWEVDSEEIYGDCRNPKGQDLIARLPMECNAGGLLTDRNRADARLIAAAPDLLAALKNAVRCGERDGMPGNPGSAPAWTVSARAAITKATGGA